MRRLGTVARIATVVGAVLAATAAPAFGAGIWTVQTTPNPSGSTIDELHAVSCSAATACTAVGRGNPGGGKDRSLVERWNGTKWSIQSSPNPKRSNRIVLNGVACAAAKSCMAVGRYDKPSGATLTLAEAWDGSAWSLVSTPNPTGQTINVLNAVSCPSATSCFAVGAAGPLIQAPNLTLIERWNGSTWKIMKSPNPTGEHQVTLTGVSCASASACIAVGYWVDANNSESMIALRWNGTKWTIQKTPDPGGTRPSGFAGVSCSSATACTAVGFYADPSNVPSSLIERWDGSAWTVQASPNPDGASATVLYAVSCPSASVCVATGSYQTIGGQFPVAERWSGSAWTLDGAAPTGSQRSNLAGVSCSSAQVCEAVGFDEDVSGNDFTLAEARS